MPATRTRGAARRVARRARLVAGVVVASLAAAAAAPTAVAQSVPGPADAPTTTGVIGPGADGSTTTTTIGPPTADPGDPDAVPPVTDPRLSPDLALVPLDGPDVAGAQARYAAAWGRQRDAERRQAAAEQSLADLAAAEQRLRGELNEAGRRHDKSAARLAALQASVRELAVASYVRGSRAGTADVGLDPADTLDRQRGKVLVDSVSGTQLNDIEVHQQVVRTTEATIADDTAALADVQLRIVDETARRDVAVRDRARAVDDVAAARQLVADVRMTAMVSGTDLSLVALDAYWRAAALTAAANPGCGLRWQALAGVGRVESLHGRYGGGPVDGNGEVRPPIIGIALDGTNDTAVIADSDGGAIDTDPVHDRAVGPMAFIPAAWRQYGVDGNGDGVKDVQNIYDAAASAAVLLCRAAPLDTDDRLRLAFFLYNRSAAYVDKVLGFTKLYDQLVIPPVPPTS